MVGPRVGVDLEVAVALTGALAVELQQMFRIEAIAGADVRGRLPGGELDADCFGDITCRKETAARLGVDELLVLVVVEFKDRVDINPTWVNGTTGEALSRDVISIRRGDDDIGALFRRAGPGLLPGAKRRAGDAEAPAPTVLQPVIPRYEEVPHRFTLFTGITAGVSVASLAGGVAMALSARGVRDDLREMGCHLVQCPDAEVSRLTTRTLLADALFAVGGAAAITALVFYYRSGGGFRLVMPTVEAGVGGTTAGITLEGAF